MASGNIGIKPVNSSSEKKNNLGILLESGKLFLSELEKFVEGEAEKPERGRGKVGPVAISDIPPPEKNFADIAQKLYKRRRQRNAIFKDINIFGEPAWDILLDLFIAGEKGKRTSVTSACIASDVPLTTALRWLTELENEGLLLREEDRRDGRRTFVSLSPKATRFMVAYFDSCA